MREAIIQKVLDKKIVAIVRGVYGQDAVNLAKALYAGGIELLEVTFDQSKPESLNRTSDTVKMLCQELGDKMYFGAGTVTTIEMLNLAKDAGASFIVSPDFNPEVIKATVEAGMVSMPGAMTPTEILTAYRAGADFVKVFPTAGLGSSYIKAVRGPLKHIPMSAVGGVKPENVGEYLDAGVCGFGVGGPLVLAKAVKSGDDAAIEERAKAFTDAIKAWGAAK